MGTGNHAPFFLEKMWSLESVNSAHDFLLAEVNTENASQHCRTINKTNNFLFTNVIDNNSSTRLQRLLAVLLKRQLSKHTLRKKIQGSSTALSSYSFWYSAKRIHYYVPFVSIPGNPFSEREIIVPRNIIYNKDRFSFAVADWRTMRSVNKILRL